MLYNLLKAMRPKQWAKNIFVFAGVFFDGRIFESSRILRSLVAFGLFCIISGAIYLINDLVDIEKDRQHPQKCKRPIASGALAPQTAKIAAVLILGICVPLGFWFDVGFGATALVYVILMLAYDFWLKNVVILDVMTVAAGFVLRVLAGALVVHVSRFSPWLYVVTTLGALYLGFGKRRAEMALLAEDANAHRRVLGGYTLPFLDQLITIVSSTTIIAYSLYTFSAPNLPTNHSMMLTIPFVIYGIFRYLYLVQVEHKGGAPEDLLFSDRPLQIVFLLLGLAVLVIFYLD